MALPVRLPKKGRGSGAQKKKAGPPYKGSMLYEVPGLASRRVKLPSAAGYEVGDRAAVETEFKNGTIRIELVRVEGGWDVAR